MKTQSLGARGIRESLSGGGEGGIRTLGTLLGYGALAKRCFRPLSHLTKHSGRQYDEKLLIANIDVCERSDRERSQLLIIDLET